MRTVIIIFLVIGGVVLLSYIGLSIFAKPDNGILELPKIDQASYTVEIKNTGGLYLTSEYDQYGQEAGKRTFILHGYWEVSGKDFKLRNSDIILQEAVFGEIVIRRR